jgi:hypothetical protein
MSCVSSRFSQIGALALDQVGHRVGAKAVEAPLEPELHHLEHLLLDLGVVPVEVRLVREEAVPVVLPGHRVPRPVAGLGVREDDARLASTSRRCRSTRRSHAPATLSAHGAPAGTRVVAGGVVQHEVGDDLEAAAVRLVDEALEVVDAAVRRVDPVVVGDVVAVVAQGRRVEREQPDDVDAQLLHVVEPLDQAAESPSPLESGKPSWSRRRRHPSPFVRSDSLLLVLAKSAGATG